MSREAPSKRLDLLCDLVQWGPLVAGAVAVAIAGLATGSCTVALVGGAVVGIVVLLDWRFCVLTFIGVWAIVLALRIYRRVLGW